MKMELIKAEFRIVTPMFLGEADGQCASQIRPPAIKGALRFWWRALNWARIRQAHDCDSEALVELHKQEADLFGRSAKTDTDGKTQIGGQGLFLLRVSEQSLSSTTAHNFVEPSNQNKKPGLAYLLGQGFYEHASTSNDYKANIKRPYIPMHGSFTLELAIKPQKKTESTERYQQQKQQLLDTLTCFGLLGCLGSRARKGFGSVSIKKLLLNDIKQPLPNNKESYKTQVKELLERCFELQQEPPLTAVTANTRIQIAKSGRDAVSLLADHGYEMGMYRSYGRKVGNEHKCFGTTAEQNFRADHDWAYSIEKSERKLPLPKRAVFGLPHPYLANGNAVFLEVDMSGKAEPGELKHKKEYELTRRASPLFAHIHQISTTEYLLVQFVMKSKFLPRESKVIAGWEKGKGKNKRTKIITAKSSQTVEPDWDWSVLTRFLDRFKDKDIIHG